MYLHGTEVKIVINNIDVFGNGDHESTQVCLDLLYNANCKDKNVLDIGCGSGIQSIFAKLWDAEAVLAVDVDMSAIKVARDNFKRNNVEIESRLNYYNEYLDFKADITVANLPCVLVKELLPVVANTMKDENSIYIFSWDKNFNIEAEVDMTGWEIVDKVEGIEYDGYAVRRTK